MVGASYFVPLGEPNHYSIISKKAPCYFLPVRMLLPDGLALVFTHEIVLRYPKHNKKDIRKAWHFAIVPTKLMTKDEYMDAVKELCEIKATADSDELVRDSDDMTGVKDFQIVELYRLMFIWYTQTADYMDRLYANDIHTWIALESPSLMEFLQDKARAGIVFSALVRMNTEDSVTLETYKSDLLNEQKQHLGGMKKSSWPKSKVKNLNQRNSRTKIQNRRRKAGIEKFIILRIMKFKRVTKLNIEIIISAS
ncbi:hypothetical protein C1645_740305 [Glomus cerebriforme]|uniref:Uncharacterized protein n=1 Tax=Glomus cerebriforme TaxID=658196 RepID=A0A397ST20_9GLOM|nr:hypothetical protein C1645_740305 [Glomus cerebriforme]